jgi:hypothetical protein
MSRLEPKQMFNRGRIPGTYAIVTGTEGLILMN